MGGLLSEDIQGRAKAGSELGRWAAAPVAEESHVRLGIQHVVVNRNDIQAIGAQGLQHRVDFALALGDVAGDLSIAQEFNPMRALTVAPISVRCRLSRPTVNL